MPHYKPVQTLDEAKKEIAALQGLLVQIRSKFRTCMHDTPVDLENPARKRVIMATIAQINAHLQPGR